MVIEIDQVKEKETSTGKEYLSIRDTNGQAYSCWKKELWNLFKRGAVLEVEVFESGDFVNITGATPSQQLPKVSNDRMAKEDWQLKDRRITRTAIAKSLIEAGYEPESERNMPRVLGTAEAWFKWVWEEVTVIPFILGEETPTQPQENHRLPKGDDLPSKEDIKTLGQLLSACLNHFGLYPNQVCEELSVADRGAIKNYGDAWEQIKAVKQQ